MKLSLQAAAIVLREGLEVLLALAAVTAYLRARQFTRFLKPLYLGVGLALLATVPVILALNESRSLTANDGIQGLIMLAAALLMLFISGWFLPSAAAMAGTALYAIGQNTRWHRKQAMFFS